MDGRSTTWTVVGIIRGVLSGPTVYANYPYYTRVARNVDRAGSVQVKTNARDPRRDRRRSRGRWSSSSSRSGLRVTSTQTIAQLRAVTINQFNVILVFLLVMAVLLAVVGALGLAGSMSINVLERTREIGVMRAVGATGRAVRGIVIGEGALIGVLSWFIGRAFALSDQPPPQQRGRHFFPAHAVELRVFGPGCVNMVGSSACAVGRRQPLACS